MYTKRHFHVLYGYSDFQFPEQPSPVTAHRDAAEARTVAAMVTTAAASHTVAPLLLQGQGRHGVLQYGDVGGPPVISIDDVSRGKNCVFLAKTLHLLTLFLKSFERSNGVLCFGINKLSSA